jgi:hypothetical protein
VGKRKRRETNPKQQITTVKKKSKKKNSRNRENYEAASVKRRGVFCDEKEGSANVRGEIQSAEKRRNENLWRCEKFEG